MEVPSITLDGQISGTVISFSVGLARVTTEDDLPQRPQARAKGDAEVILMGGPGSSSLMGMFFENGPCLVSGNSTAYNPYSWTENFHVIYLDQPAGVGYSYVSDPTAYPSRTEDSSLDAVVFVRLIYEAFPHLALADLHISGESFAGRYGPAIGSAILEYNDYLRPQEPISSKNPIIPLRSLIIGNPSIAPAIQIPSMYGVACYDYRKTYPPYLDAENCTRLEQSIDECEALLQACERDKLNRILCSLPSEACNTNFTNILRGISKSAYDRRLKCAAPGDCYPEMNDVEDYLNSPGILSALELAKQTGGRKIGWTISNKYIESLYHETGDAFVPSIQEYSTVLDYGNSPNHRRGKPVDVLLYVGLADLICNADGVGLTLESIPWEGRNRYRSTLWKDLPWKLDNGKTAGRIKSHSRLSFVEIEDAGHMVPHDQPVLSLKLVQYWLSHLNNQDALLAPMESDSQKEPPYVTSTSNWSEDL